MYVIIDYGSNLLLACAILPDEVIGKRGMLFKPKNLSRRKKHEEIY